MLREMLLLIRLWSRISPSVTPNYTKTIDSYDVMERLFHLITKYKENQTDESIHEECILLPSHVMIPPIHTVIPARGLAPAVVGLQETNISYEFGSEPDSEHRRDLPSFTVEGRSSKDWVFVEGCQDIMPMDCVRQMYLGKHPSTVKMCTRCTGTTTHNPHSKAKSSLQAWENRWLRHCPCGGPWKVAAFEE